MQPLNLGNFGGGLHTAGDAELYPDDALAEALNCVYEQNGALTIRMAEEAFTSLQPLVSSSIKAMAVWYPARKPEEMRSDAEVIFLLHIGNSVGLYYPIASDPSVNLRLTVAENLPSDFVACFYVSADKVIVTRGDRPCTEVLVNGDDQLVVRELGIDPPIYRPQIGLQSGDNLFVEVDQIDIGMGVERGNIIQYCYTVEDKYGAESNPSPIMTDSNLVWKYPHADFATGFRYYWYRALVKNLRVDNYPDVIKDNLKYYNIYRRDIGYLSGVLASQFTLVYRKEIINYAPAVYADSSNLRIKDIDYLNNQAPGAALATEVGGVTFAAGIKESDTHFPFEWDGYIEITVTNNNNLDYCDSTIAFPVPLIKAADAQGNGWNIETVAPLFSNNTYQDKLRLFFTDMITPCQVIFRYSATYNAFYMIARIPHIYRESSTKLYLCYALPSSTGKGAPSSWRSADYGMFVNINDTDFSSVQQTIIYPKAVSIDNVICAIDPGYDGYYVNNALPFPNRANANQNGILSSEATLSRGTGFEQCDIMGEVKYAKNKSINMSMNEYAIFTSSSAGGVLIHASVRLKAKDLGQLLSAQMVAGYDVYTHNHAKELFRYYLTELVDGARPGILVSIARYFASSVDWGLIIYHHTARMEEDGTTDKVTDKTMLDVIKIKYDQLGYGYTDQTAFTKNFEFTLKLSTQGGKKVATIYGDNGCVVTAWNNAAEYTDKWFKVLSYGSGEDALERGLLIYSYCTSVFYNYMVYTGQPRHTSDTIMAAHKAYVSQQTPYKEMMGQCLCGSTDSWTLANTPNISMEHKDIETKSLPADIRWSSPGGGTFNGNNFMRLREPLLGIIGSPSFLKEQYQNTVICFTRNTVTRLVFSDDFSQMAANPDSMIGEFTSCGLFAPKTLVAVPNGLVWLSEAGVMSWTADGLSNLSGYVLDLNQRNRATDFVGAYYPDDDQYFLSDNGTGYTYVYHFSTKNWTRFSSFNFDITCNLNQGNDYDNRLLFINDDGVWSYPSGETTGEDVVVTTKKIRLDNTRPIRYRLLWHGDTDPTRATATSYNNFFGKEMEAVTDNPQRFRWIMLPNGFWGEYLQFTLDGVDKLTRIEVGLKEGI